jgi:hypothetical protein
VTGSTAPPGRHQLRRSLPIPRLDEIAIPAIPAWGSPELWRLRQRAMRLGGIIAALALFGTLTATVTAVVERTTGTTLTEGRAVDRTEEHLRKAKAGVGLPMRLDVEVKRMTSCGDSPGRTGRERIEHRYWVRDVGIPNADVFNAFRRFWQGHGYVVTKDDVQGSGVLTVRSGTDGYLLTLSQNQKGELTLAVASPCTVEERR